MTLSACPSEGSGGVKMPDEEHPAVDAGGGQRQGMSDAETAVVFHQGTGGALQLHAQQAVRKVITAAWLQRSPTLFPAVSRLDSAGFPLHLRPRTVFLAIVFRQCGGVSPVRV